MKSNTLAKLFLFSSSLFCLPAHAEDLTWGGHLKLEPSVTFFESGSLGEASAGDAAFQNELNARLFANGKRGIFESDIHGEYLMLTGDAVKASDTPTGLLGATRSVGLPDDRRRLLDLTEELFDESTRQGVLRLDRLSVGIATEQLVLKVGRQAITLGNGLQFSVFDLFNPFSPTEIDKEFKAGDDLLYGQYAFQNGANIQGIVVGRREEESGSIEAEEGSSAVFFQDTVAQSDLSLLLARHYNESVFGAGLAHSIFDAVMRVDVSLTELRTGGHTTSVIINLDRTFVLREKNLYAFLEYFHSGFGTEKDSYLMPPEKLSDRLQRGELFTLGKDYLASGFDLELTPLVHLLGNGTFNLHDSSAVLQQRLSYELRDNLVLILGLTTPLGPKGSEYGGLVLPESSQALTQTSRTLSSGQEVYLRASWYF